MITLDDLRAVALPPAVDEPRYCEHYAEHCRNHHPAVAAVLAHRSCVEEDRLREAFARLPRIGRSA